nr:MAG TPA: Protein of unknown function (DUF4236) [Caudoviricetes sp.]
MGLRFRKSFKIAPGVKLNVNKKSVGMTFGGKGAHYTVNSSGRRTTSIGVPGTGMYYQDVKNASAKSSTKATSNQGFSQSSSQGFNQASGECPCCGAANQQGFAFCKVCGQPLSTPTRQIQPTYSQPVYVSPGYAPRQQAKPKRNYTNIICTIFMIVILAAVAKWIWTTSDNYIKEQKAKQESIAQQDAQRAQQAQQPLQPPTTTNSADVQNAQSDAPSDAPSDAQSDAAATDQNRADMVWYSAGGSRYHRNSNCSNMSNPQQITKEEAESMGLTPCKKCY